MNENTYRQKSNHLQKNVIKGPSQMIMGGKICSGNTTYGDNFFTTLTPFFYQISIF